MTDFLSEAVEAALGHKRRLGDAEAGCKPSKLPKLETGVESEASWSTPAAVSNCLFQAFHVSEGQQAADTIDCRRTSAIAKKSALLTHRTLLLASAPPR